MILNFMHFTILDDYISVSFTLDLDNINLKDKTSEDVLKLIVGE